MVRDPHRLLWTGASRTAAVCALVLHLGLDDTFGFQQPQKVVEIGNFAVLLMVKVGNLSNRLALRKLLQQFHCFRWDCQKSSCLDPPDDDILTLGLACEGFDADGGVSCVHLSKSRNKRWE